MEIKGANYRVSYDSANAVVCFEGSLQLEGADYGPIESLLEKVLMSEPRTITLDVQNLDTPYSSGVNVLYKFAVAMRKKGEMQLVVRGSKKFPWQGKSLPNLTKFNPNVELTLCD